MFSQTPQHTELAEVYVKSTTDSTSQSNIQVEDLQVEECLAICHLIKPKNKVQPQPL